MSKRITSLTALTTPKDDMELMVYDVDDTYDKKITYANLMKPLTGSGAPAITPDFIGQRYIDTTGNREYFAIGTSTSADWRKVARYDYGTVTVTAGGGDVTVNLDFDWSDGILFAYRAIDSTNYVDGALTKFETTYDALTNSAYDSNQVFSHDVNTAICHEIVDKAVNSAGLPKSATITSFTLDDSGVTTVYIKWVIIA